MQLKQIKYIKNNHCLSGFAEGVDGNSSQSVVQQMINDPDFKTIGIQQYDASKYVKNLSTDELSNFKPVFPKTGATSSFNIGGALNKAGGIASSALGAFSAINNAFHAPVKSERQMNSEAGISRQSINGVSTQLQNDVDTAGQIKEINAENTQNTLAAAGAGAQVGQKVGSLLGPIGGLAGGVIGGIGGFVAGIFGGKNRKRKLMARIRTANINNALGNNQRLSYANTQGLQQQYDANHENTEDDLLYANFGKSSLRMIRYVK